MGLVLLLIAFIFTSVLTVLMIPYNVLYYIVTFKWGTGLKELNKYCYQLAIIVDVFANESLQVILNRIMIKGNNKFLFGNDDRDSLSYVIAINKKRGALTKFGMFWAKFLNWVDKDHLQKAIDNKIVRYLKYKNRI